MPDEIFHISMSELRKKFVGSFHNGTSSSFNKSQNAEIASKYVVSASDKWAGASSREYVEYLENGYSVPQLEDFDTSLIPVRKKKRARFNDSEGDFRLDLFESGDENCFMDFTKREAVPGIHIQFFLGFRGNAAIDAINDYCRWILQAITTLEASGVDCSISAFNRGSARFARGREISEFQIDIKREGERNDFTDWSAILAPGSYRILGFFCICLMADHFGRVANGSMGSSRGQGWSVTFNEETRVIEIGADSSASYFPNETMTAALGDAIAKARGE